MLYHYGIGMSGVKAGARQRARALLIFPSESCSSTPYPFSLT
jgi:hypothetical protein